MNTVLQKAGKIGVLYGGNSAERAVSLNSGQAVYDSLKAQGANVVLIDTQDDVIQKLTSEGIDTAFIVVHGGAGEDGRLQALLEFLNIPYTGSGVRACALAMDKLMTKQLWNGVGLSTAEFEVLAQDTHWQAVIDRLGSVMVKPAREGSSIGMSIANTAEELSKAYDQAHQFDDCIIAERLINGSEFTVAIVNGEVLPPIRLETDNVFYDYQAKYESNETRYVCPCGLPEAQEQALKTLSKEAFDAVSGKGWGRVDVMCDKQGVFYLLEVNMVPGMTSHSLVPMAAKAQGWNFGELLINIIEGAIGDNV